MWRKSVALDTHKFMAAFKAFRTVQKQTQSGHNVKSLAPSRAGKASKFPADPFPGPATKNQNLISKLEVETISWPGSGQLNSYGR